MIKNYQLIFMMMMMLSSIMSISSLTWFSSWMGLEINLLSFMPLISTNKNKPHSESSIKYFMAQSLASTIFIFSIILYSNMKSIEFYNMNMNNYITIMINLALMMKLGMAPLHFWMPEVASGMKWDLIIILLTWQKIAPSILLTYTNYLPNFLMIFIIFSTIISGIYSFNQTCLRKILVYSSINHLSWMMSLLMNSIKLWMIYFLIYSIINMNIIMIFMKYNIFYFNQLNKLFSYNKKLKLMFMMNFLSLAGLPPFLGFLPKWITIFILIKNNFLFISFILIVFSMISIYVYMRMCLSSFSLNNKESINNHLTMMKSSYFYINFISLFMLVICFLFPINLEFKLKKL